ncbi:CehA/McbA family metallohydrolase [Nannocystis radixulma]|uniref:CehA/McbA family metallohydrolase n=1 Tax=Nannocystis radixulma TaxID=2995305 RepID=A0ABT5BI92_9BACT|nr:CehA/McbA family metallohydrolase [Nannocystis radixulma]MDC0673876.1 CehA/McbA family metallohydrolase [Nannocystis radixulma]
MPRLRFTLALLTALVLPTPGRAAETVQELKGQVPMDSLEHFFVAFDVPPGTREIEIAHDDLSDDNILDWGLVDPHGVFRGWGGGNGENAVVSEAAATRSYLPGAIAPGTWSVVVGKAKIAEPPGEYEITVTLRDAPTLAPQPERAPYQPATLGGEPRWYAGDFHVHSRDSGDASPSLDVIAEFARGRGLDFVVVTDHNTTSHLDFFADAQARHPDLLFVPGCEFTTYAGHMNAIGATAWVDHKLGQPGVTITAAADAYDLQGAVLSANHPALALGDLCIGCAWQLDLDPARLGAVEIATGGLDKAGMFFTDDAMRFWDDLCDAGHQPAPIGGSDDHKGGVDLGGFDSPIGDPTTLVYADTLGVDAILAGLRTGHTVVKLQGPGDPMLELSSGTHVPGDSFDANLATLKVRVTGAPAGASVRLVRDRYPLDAVPVAGDPFEHEFAVEPPEGGRSRWRAEVLVDGAPRTVTNHLWIARAPTESPTTGAATTGAAPTTGPDSTTGAAGSDTDSASTSAGATPSETGCGCRSVAPPSPVLLAILLLRRRRSARVA